MFCAILIICGAMVATVLLAAAIYLNTNRWKLLVLSLVLTIFVGVSVVAMLATGDRVGVVEYQLAAQFVMLFTSVLCGSLCSTAISEIRQARFSRTPD